MNQANSNLKITSEEDLIHNVEMNKNVLKGAMLSLNSLQNEITKDELRISTTIIFSLGGILNEIEILYYLLTSKEEISITNSSISKAIRSIKLRNDDMFLRMRKGIPSISSHELQDDLRVSLDAIEKLYLSIRL